MAETGILGDLDVSEFSPTQKKALEVLALGGTLKDLRGLSNDDLETIYSIGYNLYNQNKYSQAEPMFQFACFYGHNEPRYWMALGNCRQMQKNYQGAIDSYGFSFMLDIKDPWPLIQAALCYLAMGNKELARDSLDVADKTIQNGPTNETARLRVAALRKAL
jgi:type III secretion system low calcium response chaperone LcrH/SycD